MQVPLFVDARIISTSPAIVSAGLGIYVAVKVLLLGLKEPVPDVVHIPVVLPPVTLPVRATFGFEIHTKTSRPASTNGDGV